MIAEYLVVGCQTVCEICSYKHIIEKINFAPINV